ncbi:MAG: extracellular solute-binding protein, partial [Gemmatimonadetes bacterium]|nr:extracellular solute-binding protein [Gemmatimonadota bacterium]
SIGGTSTDLVEMGSEDISTTARYYISNTEYVQLPNPYNRGTDLESVPWMDTYLDGMLGSLDRSSLEYYGAASSGASVRMFYNRRLLRESLGLDEPPTDYREFLAACSRFSQWARDNDRSDLVPIASSKYQMSTFSSIKSSTLLDFILAHDRDYDGEFGLNDELFLAYAGGEFDYHDPAIRADVMTLGELTRHFSPGFMAMGRMEAQFVFTQGRALFSASGSWDALSYENEVDFPLGIADFPRPDRDDPEFGPYVRGHASEAEVPSVLRLGISKASRHPEVALRFLQFLTSRENNERFNWQAKWPPLIKGARPHPLMVPFVRRPGGFWTGDVFSATGGAASAVHQQASWELLEHKIDYDGFVTQIEAGMPRAMAQEFERMLQAERETRLLQGMGLSHHLGTHTGATEWSSSPTELATNRSRTAAKLTHLWETRMTQFRNGHRIVEWRKLLQEKEPVALQIASFLTTAVTAE